MRYFKLPRLANSLLTGRNSPEPRPEWGTGNGSILITNAQKTIMSTFLWCAAFNIAAKARAIFMQPKQIRAAYDLRVSTESQELQNQRAEIVPLIVNRSWRLVHTFEDSMSGRETDIIRFDEVTEPSALLRLHDGSRSQQQKICSRVLLVTIPFPFSG